MYYIYYIYILYIYFIYILYIYNLPQFRAGAVADPQFPGMLNFEGSKTPVRHNPNF